MKHLTTRLVIVLMLAFLAITGTYDYLRLARDRERLVEQTQRDERIFAETLALAVSRNIRWGRTSIELRELLEDILSRPGLIGVTIYDPKAEVIAQVVAAKAPAPTLDGIVRDTLRTKRAASVMEDVGESRVLRHIQPFRWPGGRTAAIEVRQTLEAMETAFRHEVRNRIFSRVIVLIAFVLSVVTLTRWSIARPIRALIRAARAVGRGDLAQRIDVARRDEIGQLAEEFNRMAANLQTAHEELLRQADERLRLEGEVQQSQKMAAIGMLAAKVAHEIGTPLNVIAGRAEALGRTVPVDHPERRHLDLILRQTERITGIIRTLLDYSRPRRPELQRAAVAPILDRVADLLLARCRAMDVRIDAALPASPPEVWGNADQLQQLFLNLLLNALDASPRGATIRIVEGPEPVLPRDGGAGITRGKAEAACLAIHVVDEGGGISADRLSQVFQPFFSTKERGHGTGLGLPIAEEIVRVHRGEIEVLSIPGRGTEVIVRLPLAEVPLGPGPAHEAASVAEADGR